MSKGNRSAAQERARRVLEEQRRRQQARQRRIAMAGAAVVVVLAAVVFMVVTKVAGGSGKVAAAPSTSTDAAAAVEALTSVPASTLDQVGQGDVTTLPTPVTGEPVLTKDGKPLIVYIGAEYCPYCAAQRWAVVVALSRFGTFSDMTFTHSAGPPEVFPNTPTPTFHGTGYTSDHLVFQGVETQSNVVKGNTYEPLDKLTSQQQELLKKYDAPPYVPQESAGAIPFLDLGNTFVITGSSYDPTVLKDKSAIEIADALSDPSSPIAKAIGGAANSLTTGICKLTNNQPGDVCTSAAAKAYAGKL